MGTICGCKKEDDNEMKEEDLSRMNMPIGNINQLNDGFNKKIEAKLFAMNAEYLLSPLEELLPSKIRQLRELDPFPNLLEERTEKLYKQGEIKVKNDFIYRGTWNSNLEMEGRGLMYIINKKIVYEGYWISDIFISGRVYSDEGWYQEGKFDGTFVAGQGKYANILGEKFEGNFLNGYREGQGSYHFNDGCIYIGNFREDKMDGEGLMQWADQNRYQGYFSDNGFHGKGHLMFYTGSTYYGDFRFNYADGQGEFIWSNGDKYIGKYEHGKKNGIGTYTSKTWEIQGLWSAGLLQGKCIIYYNDKVFPALYRNGRLTEIQDNSGKQDLSYFTSPPIQNEDIDPEKLTHIAKFDESTNQFYQPEHGKLIGSQAYEYLYSSKNNDIIRTENDFD